MQHNSHNLPFTSTPTGNPLYFIIIDMDADISIAVLVPTLSRVLYFQYSDAGFSITFQSRLTGVGFYFHPFPWPVTVNLI